MKKLILLIITLFTLNQVSPSQDPQGPPSAVRPGAQQAQDRIIEFGTKNISLVFRVSARDGRLYQAYFGSRLENTDQLIQTRDAGHLAYATFGTDNLFEPAVRATHNDGNPSLELKFVNQSY